MRHYPDVANHDPDMDKVATLVKKSFEANVRLFKYRKVQMTWWAVRLLARFMLFWAVEKKLLRSKTRTKLIRRELLKALAPAGTKWCLAPTSTTAPYTMAFVCQCGLPVLAYGRSMNAVFLGTCKDGHTATLETPAYPWRATP